MSYAKVLFVFLVLTSQALAKDGCLDKVQQFLRKYSEPDTEAVRKQYGIERKTGGDAKIHSPSKCTKLMQGLDTIPLKSRKDPTGQYRERWMDSNCNIYEWDYRHGQFERYTMSGSGLNHTGEMSPLSGELDESKAKPKQRNYSHNEHQTGYDGYTPQQLCKDHKKGKITDVMVQKSQGSSNRLRCKPSA